MNSNLISSLGSKQIKQEEPEMKTGEGVRTLTLKRAIDEVAGQTHCDEQLERISGCKIKLEDANDDGSGDGCGTLRLLPSQPSTSHSVTVSCEATGDTILKDFNGKKSTSTKIATNLRHVLVFKGVEMEYFIDLVRRNEVLWDGSVDEYHTRTNKKKQAWESIALEMSNDVKQVDEETCRKIWLQLRRSYANEKRQQKLNFAPRTTRNCKYRRYFDAMKFLDGIMDEEISRHAASLNDRVISLDGVSESFFISEPEGGKSCSNSPAPDLGTSKKDVEITHKAGGDSCARREVQAENDVSTSKVIDTITLLAQQLQGQGNEPVEVAQSAQLFQPKVDTTTSATTQQQFYQQLQTCFFMLTPEKQAILQRDIMKFAFRRTNQLMDDPGL